MSSINKPFEYNDPETGKPWVMNVNDGYKLLFNVVNWTGNFDIDKSKIHAYL